MKAISITHTKAKAGGVMRARTNCQNARRKRPVILRYLQYAICSLYSDNRISEPIAQDTGQSQRQGAITRELSKLNPARVKKGQPVIISVSSCLQPLRL